MAGGGNFDYCIPAGLIRFLIPVSAEISSSGDAPGLPPPPAAEKSATSRFARFGLPAILVAAAVAAYANSFAGPFFFDDQGSITENPTIRSLRPLLRVLHPPEAARDRRPSSSQSVVCGQFCGGWPERLGISCAQFGDPYPGGPDLVRDPAPDTGPRIRPRP